MLADGTSAKLKKKSSKCQIHFSPKMVSVILDRSYHTDVFPSAHSSEKFVLNELFDGINRRCDMIDSCDSCCQPRSGGGEHEEACLMDFFKEDI